MKSNEREFEYKKVDISTLGITFVWTYPYQVGTGVPGLALLFAARVVTRKLTRIGLAFCWWL